MSTNAPRTGDQAAAFLRAAHTGPLTWHRKCLQLQREARGLPAVYPSALAAALATPKAERVTRIADLRRGMVAYSDDPNDNNPAGHIYFIAGWSGPRDSPANLLTWSSDVLRTGGVDLVPVTFYKAHWGDTFQFGATWLNGYNFADLDAPPVATRGSLGENFDHAIEDVRKAIRLHRKAGHTQLVNALVADLQQMLATKKRWP